MPCTTPHVPGTLCFDCHRARLADPEPAEGRNSGVRIERRERFHLWTRRDEPELTGRQIAHRRAMLAHLQQTR